MSLSGLNLSSVGLSGEDVSFNETSTLGVYTATMPGGDFYITDGTNSYGYTGSASLSGILDNTQNVIRLSVLLSPNYYTVTIDLTNPANMTYNAVATMFSGLSISSVGLSSGDISFNETSTPGVYSATMLGGDFSLIDNNLVTYGYASAGVLDNSTTAISISPLLTSPNYYTVTINLVNMTYTSVTNELTGLSLTSVGLSSGDISFNETSTPGVYSATMLGGSFSLIDNNSVTYGFASTGVLNHSTTAISISPLLTSPNYYTVTINLVNMTYSSVATVLSGLSLTSVGLSGGDISFNETSTPGVYSATMRGGSFSLIDNNSVTYGYASAGILNHSTTAISVSPLLTSPNYYVVTINLVNMTYSSVSKILTGLSLTSVGLSGGDISFNETSTPGVYSATLAGGSFSLIDNNSVTYGNASAGVLNNSTNTISISPMLTGLNYYTVTINLVNMTYSSVATMISGLNLLIVRTAGGANVSLNEISPGVYQADFQGGNYYIADTNSNTYRAITQYSLTGTLGYNTGSNIVFTALTQPDKYTLTVNLTNMTYNAIITIIPTPPRVPCFKEGSKILTDKGYVEVEKLRKGDLVQTSVHGFVPIHMIGYTQLEHLKNSERIKDQLYVCSKAEFPEVDEDLIITGCHSILVDDFIDNQRAETEKLLTKIYVTDNKYRLPACLDKRTKVYDSAGTYTIYHIALENENYYKNYGVYANGLLVETCSKRYLKEESKMTLIE